MDGELPRPLVALLDEFKRWDEATRKKSERRGKVRGSLHHYSDMSALVGIAQNNELWLTSIFHMNDPSELVHGIDLAIARLDWYLRRQPKNALNIPTLIVDSFCDRMRDSLAEGFGGAFGFFVASFSKTKDDLGQWRSYADDGRGVAIEVSAEWFAPVEPPPNADIRDLYSVSAVEYDENKARKRQADAIDRAVQLIERAANQNLLNDKNVRTSFLQEMRVRLAVPLLWNSLTTKHPAYKHEQETRLIMVNDISKLSSVIRTRTRGSQIVSYVPIRFPIRAPNILRHVMIGPAAIGDPESGVENLLRSKGIDPTDRVTRSGIPYRPR